MLPKGFKFQTYRFARFDSPSNPGERMKVKYSSKLDEEGRIVLDKVGEEDLYDYIQSFAESADIAAILARFQRGDESALNQTPGFYFDMTMLPKTMPELLNKINEAQIGFENMPVEFKEKYDNDFARFICTFVPESDSVPSASDDGIVKEQEGVTDES